MKRVTKILGLMLALLIATPLFAQSVGKTFSGPVYFKSAKILLDGNSVISPSSGSTGTLTKAHIVDRTRYLDLPIGNWKQLLTGGEPPVTGTPVPIMAAVNNSVAIHWAVGDTAKVSTVFRVPADYVSGATFKCMISLAAASTNTTVGFELFKNTDAVVFDTAATSQTPAAVANETTKMHDLSLVVATDTFAAGDVVTFNVWRAAGSGTGAELYLYDCYLSYTADM